MNLVGDLTSYDSSGPAQRQLGKHTAVYVPGAWCAAAQAQSSRKRKGISGIMIQQAASWMCCKDAESLSRETV